MTDGPPHRHLTPVTIDGENEPPFDPDYDAPPTTGPGATSRTPIANRAAERAVLGALLTDPDHGAQLEPHLEPHDFYWPNHATLWDAWHHLATTTGTPPDPVTLNHHLVTTRQTDLARELPTLLAACPNPAAAETYAGIVRDNARLRAVDDTATRLRDLATRGDIDQIDARLGEALQHLDDTVLRFGPRTGATGSSTGLADLSWVLTGTPPAETPPAWCKRADGTALFYVGRHNGVFGDPESGKTWLALIAGVEALLTGGTFAMVDVDHNGQNHTAGRLARLGVPFEAIANPEKFRYYEPEDADQLRAAVTDITTRAPDVVLLDSIGEILPMLDVKSVDNDEITAALRTIVMPPAKAGSCVISVDHLPKSVEARSTGYAIGGTAKKRAVDGAYLRAEAKLKPAPDSVGRIMLRIEKDRTGELRRSSAGGYAGTFTLDSTQPHATTWQIGRDEMPKNADGSARPTGLMEKISRFIEDNDQCTFTEIKDAVTGKDRWLRDAITILVSNGFVARLDGQRRAKLHQSIAPYREAEDDHLNPTD